MKKYQLIIILSVFTQNDLFSQSHLDEDTNMYYKNSKDYGEYFQGKKVGKWMNLGPCNIIYSESYFDSIGSPTGVWKINYPDGTLRRVSEFSNGNATKLVIYRYKKKFFEIVADKPITENLYLLLSKFESDMFESETKMVKSLYEPNDQMLIQVSNTEYKLSPYWLIGGIHNIFIGVKFNGTTYLWDQDNTLRRKCIYINGSEYRISYFYNKAKKVSRQDEYIDDKIVKTITFKSNGEQKIKTY